MITLGLSLLFTPISVSAIPSLHIYFIDVGYGDAILIQLPNGGTLLIDSGKPEAAPQVIAQLETLGIKQLDQVILTHFHKDHAGGLSPILKNYFSLKPKLWIGLPFSPFEMEIEPEVMQTIDMLKQYPIKILQKGEQLQPSPHVLIEILHPEILSGNQNEDSLVLKMTHGALSFLLAADAGPKTQRTLVARYGPQLQSDLIKIPHHANETEILPSFINAVNPEIAILTIGPNTYNAPNLDILEAYQKTGAQLFRTDQHGTVHITSDGKTLQAVTAKP